MILACYLLFPKIVSETGTCFTKASIYLSNHDGLMCTTDGLSGTRGLNAETFAGVQTVYHREDKMKCLYTSVLEIVTHITYCGLLEESTKAQTARAGNINVAFKVYSRVPVLAGNNVTVTDMSTHSFQRCGFRCLTETFL